MIDLRQLQCFCVVAEELNFTRAAERLNMAQPPLSQRIRHLEEELDVQLLDRDSRPIRLTSAGALLLDRSRDLIALLDKSIEEVRRVGRGQSGRLSVGFVGSAMYSVVPSILSTFSGLAPDIELSLQEMLAADIAAALADRQIDVGFTRPPLPYNAKFEQKVVRTESVVLALPAQHAFTKASELSWKDLEDVPLILYPRYPLPSLTDWVHAACISQQFEARIVQETHHLATALGMVAAGIGATIVVKSVGIQNREGVSFVPFDADAPTLDLTVVWHKGVQNPALHRFLQVVADAAPI